MEFSWRLYFITRIDALKRTTIRLNNISSENNYEFNWNLDIIPNTNHSWQPSLQFALNLINN